MYKTWLSSVSFVYPLLYNLYLPMAKRTHAQVQAEPAVAVRKLKKPVKKQAKPSDPDAPTGKNCIGTIDIGDCLLIEWFCKGPRRAKVAALNNAGQ